MTPESGDLEGDLGGPRDGDRGDAPGHPVERLPFNVVHRMEGESGILPGLDEGGGEGGPVALAAIGGLGPERLVQRFGRHPPGLSDVLGDGEIQRVVDHGQT
jgi:hypothetical protein